MRILLSSTVSSWSTMQTVSLRFFPLMRTVSPRKRLFFSIVLGCSATTELSSFTASSTTRRLSFFFRSRIAVEKSFFSLCGTLLQGHEATRRTSMECEEKTQAQRAYRATESSRKNPW